MKSEHHYKIAFAVGLTVLVIMWWNGTIPSIVEQPIEVQLSGFEKIALLILIGFEAIPTILKQIWSVGAFTTLILSNGFSPIILGILLATGQLMGQMGLYIVGMFSKKINGESIGKIADKNHFLHKHHWLLYPAIPFMPLVGEGIMLASGHQRINPLKIIPFLFVSNLADNYKHIYQTVINLEVSEALG